MDLEHAATLLPLVIAVLAVIPTLYPPASVKSRRLWATIFLVVGGGTCSVLWWAVTLSQRAHTELVSGVTGGDNFPYVYPIIFCDYGPIPCSEPFGKIPMELRKAKTGPLYNVTVVKAVAQHDPQQTYFFLELDNDTPLKGLLAEEGLNGFYIEARNGRWTENILIERGDRGWKKSVFVYNWQRGELKPVFEEAPSEPTAGSPIARAPLPKP
jgi:hypothetical protein